MTGEKQDADLVDPWGDLAKLLFSSHHDSCA